MKFAINVAKNNKEIYKLETDRNWAKAKTADWYLRKQLGNENYVRFNLDRFTYEHIEQLKNKKDQGEYLASIENLKKIHGLYNKMKYNEQSIKPHDIKILANFIFEFDKHVATDMIHKIMDEKYVKKIKQ